MLLNVEGKMGGSPGLVVMGDDWCLRGRGFESQRHLLDRYFFTLICYKNWIVCLKRPKINKKKPWLAHLCLFLVLLWQTFQFLQQYNVKKCPSSIRCWDLNPQRLEHESPCITTRPGFLFVWYWVAKWKHIQCFKSCTFAIHGFDSQASRY